MRERLRLIGDDDGDYAGKCACPIDDIGAIGCLKGNISIGATAFDCGFQVKLFRTLDWSARLDIAEPDPINLNAAITAATVESVLRVTSYGVGLVQVTETDDVAFANAAA